MIIQEQFVSHFDHFGQIDLVDHTNIVEYECSNIRKFQYVPLHSTNIRKHDYSKIRKFESSNMFHYIPLIFERSDI